MSQNLRDIAKKHEWQNIRWFRRMAPVYDILEILRVAYEKRLSAIRGYLVEQGC